MIALLLLLAQVASLLGQGAAPPAVPTDGWQRSSPYDRTGYYHRLRSTRELLLTHWTHVEVQAVVLGVVHEADGDLHLRLGDGSVAICTKAAYARGQCIVAEVRPGNTETMERAERSRVGDTVIVRGVSRFDRQHGSWAEVHPVDSLTIIACADNAEPPCR